MYINLFPRGGLLPLNVETTFSKRSHSSTAKRMELFPRSGLDINKLISYNLPVIGGSAGVGLGNSIGDDPGVGGNLPSTDTQISGQSTSVVDGSTMTVTTEADTATAQPSVSTTLPTPVSGNTSSTSNPAPSVSAHSASTMSSASSRVPQPSVQVQSSAEANTAGGTESKSLPGAAIAGIVFGVLFFALAVGVLVFRARSIRRRSRKRETWVSKPFMVSTTRTVLTDRPIMADGTGAGASNPGATAGIGGTNSVAVTPAARPNLKIPRVKPPPLLLLSVPGPESAGLDSGSGSSYFSASHRLSANSTTSSLMVQTNSAPPSIGATYGALTNVGVVRCIFEPRLPDELRIRVGDAMRVLAEYDDGWGLCENTGGERGMVPLQCLDRGMEDDGRIGLARPASERLSMLGVTGRTMRQSSLPALV